MKEGHLQPGDCISLDQYESSTRGRLPNTKGREAKSDKFCGDTIAIDHKSGKIWVHHQVSLRAGETLSGKHIIERDFQTIGRKVKQYHSDNGVFRSKEFQADLKLHHQTIDFSGVGAHHQNGVAERAICTVVEWAHYSPRYALAGGSKTGYLAVRYELFCLDLESFTQPQHGFVAKQNFQSNSRTKY